jgi:hypothetical protein
VVGGEVNEEAVNLLLVFGVSAILQVQLETSAYRPKHFCWEEFFQCGAPFVEDIMGLDLLDKRSEFVGPDAVLPEQDFNQGNKDKE